MQPHIETPWHTKIVAWLFLSICIFLCIAFWEYVLPGSGIFLGCIVLLAIAGRLLLS